MTSVLMETVTAKQPSPSLSPSLPHPILYVAHVLLRPLHFAQFWDRETASFQLFRSKRACDAGICGSKLRSLAATDVPRSIFQKSTARPAKYAAPSAVVSVIAGRMTGTPRMSDWN